MGMSQAVTAETLTAIILAAGLPVREFNIKATLRRVAAYDRDMARSIADGGHPSEYGPVDMETVTEWLDESNTKASTYQLATWLA